MHRTSHTRICSMVQMDYLASDASWKAAAAAANKSAPKISVMPASNIRASEYQL